MISWILRLFKWLISIWETIPEPIKNSIIKFIVTSFEELFRAFYKKCKEEDKEAQNNNN